MLLVVLYFFKVPEKFLNLLCRVKSESMENDDCAVAVIVAGVQNHVSLSSQIIQ